LRTQEMFYPAEGCGIYVVVVVSIRGNVLKVAGLNRNSQKSMQYPLLQPLFRTILTFVMSVVCM
jgi:hypothetical protein